MPALSGAVSGRETILVEVSVGQHVTAVSECSVEADRVVLLRCHLLEDFAYPVGVGEIVRVRVVAHLVEMFRKPGCRAAYILSCLVVEGHELDRVAHLRQSCRSLYSGIG